MSFFGKWERSLPEELSMSSELWDIGG